MYREDFITTFYGVENLEYEVEIQENQDKPGLYRLVNPYGAAYAYNEAGDWDASKDWYIEIDATDPEGVIINHQEIGMNWGNGMFSVWSMASYYMVRQGKTLEEVKADGLCGTLEDGIITFPANGLLISMAEYNEGGFYQANSNGLFRVVLPGYTAADYSCTVTYAGRFTDMADNDYAYLDVTLAADVASAKLAVVEGKSADAGIAAILGGADGVIDVNESGRVSVQMTASGTFTAVVVTFDAEGTPKDASAASYKFQLSTENAPTWHSLGMAQYTDDALLPLYTEDKSSITYEVEVQESDATPGLYRLVNPYGAAHPANEEGDWDASKDYFMEINCVDPEGCYIELQDMGVNWGDGMFAIYSYAAYYLDNGKTLDDAKAAGCCGTLANGVITFPEKTILCTFDGAGPYVSSPNGAFKVVLPSAVGGEDNGESAGESEDEGGQEEAAEEASIRAKKALKRFAKKSLNGKKIMKATLKPTVM